jgi:hypothetical protein
MDIEGSILAAQIWVLSRHLFGGKAENQENLSTQAHTRTQQIRGITALSNRQVCRFIAANYLISVAIFAKNGHPYQQSYTPYPIPFTVQTKAIMFTHSSRSSGLRSFKN